MKRKIVFLPYDLDTALGINNEGALVFGYNLEDTDHTASGAEIFNGQSSVLWNNLRDAFGDELKAMYKDLRSKGKISYPLVEGMFEEHQSKWPEAIFNEDAWYKYLAPLVESGDASYLSMLQGSKEEQRKWWLYNRFRYIDSKYNAGDALSDVITIRAYAKSNVTVVPYADIYASVRYGSYDVQQRATRGQAYTLECPVDRLNDTEVYIYSASQLASVGDLSGFKVGYANFSMATKLQSLKLGDADSEYENGNLTELYLGNNELLQTIDIRNCPNLTQPVDISGCKNIEYVYFDGTAITGLSLPNGGIVKALHLPATLANLTILNQPAITDFTLPSAANVTTLRLENVSSAVDEMAILMALPAAARVRLIGFAWQAENYAQVSAIYDRLDLMRGLDEAGGNVDTAQLMGTVHVPTLTMAQIASLRERHPDITVTYDHVITYLYYRDYDNTLLYTETITDGGDGVYDGQPTRPSGDGKVYTFEGWNTQQGATEADANATKAVTTDRTVYAAYSFVGIAHLRYYTYDGATLLQDEEVLDGGDGTYAGTPARAADAQYTYAFAGWSTTKNATSADANATKNVTTDRNVYAAYTRTTNTYTVTFVRASGDGGGTLQTLTGVAYGTTPSYTGPTPTTTQGSAAEYPFEGWTPALGPISGNTTYTARFGNAAAPSATTADGAYGVEWAYNNSATALTRKGLAAGFANPAPATDLTGSGSSPFDTIAPWKDMKRYNVIGAELVPDTDSRFDEAAYDTVVYIPEFYYTAYKDTENNKWLWAISPTELEGYKKHPGSGVYVGRFHTSGSSSAVFTKGGMTPLGGTTRSNFRTYSRAKGTGWWQIDLKTWSAIQMLYLVEFANWDSQDTLGGGANSRSVLKTGATTGAAYHTIKRSNSSNTYRWIENPFSNLHTWVDGILIGSYTNYISTDPDDYDDDINKLEDAGITLPSSGFISGIGYSKKCPWAFIPDAASGSETTYVTDRVYTNTATYALYVGGHAYPNDGNGMFYFDASHKLSEKPSANGSRLIYQP